MTSRSRQLSLGEVLRDEGIRAVAADNQEWLSVVRREAARLCARNGEVSSVELRAWCDERNYHPFSQNAWGAIFSGKQWQHVGWRKTEHADGHARDVKVWKYVSTT
jgi:hypothetical protein